MQPTSAQETALQQLGTVPGIVGSMVMASSGAVVASSFPPVFDPAGLQQLASQLAGDGYFQEWLASDRGALDLRYSDGRVIIRSMQGSWLLVLCTAQANSQLLSMTMTQAVRRLRAPHRAADAGATPPRTSSALDRLRAIATAELGAHAGQALEILAAAGSRPKDLARAAADIEKMTRLFIDKRKAEEIAQRMRDVLEA